MNKQSFQPTCIFWRHSR